MYCQLIPSLAVLKAGRQNSDSTSLGRLVAGGATVRVRLTCTFSPAAAAVLLLWTSELAGRTRKELDDPWSCASGSLRARQPATGRPSFLLPHCSSSSFSTYHDRPLRHMRSKELISLWLCLGMAMGSNTSQSLLYRQKNLSFPHIFGTRLLYLFLSNGQSIDNSPSLQLY